MSERRILGYVAYHDDWSAFRIFFAELAALRYAVDHGMQVVRVHNGDDPRVVVREQLPAAQAPVSDPEDEAGGGEG